jgi:hypothetical protein
MLGEIQGRAEVDAVALLPSSRLHGRIIERLQVSQQKAKIMRHSQLEFQVP